MTDTVDAVFNELKKQLSTFLLHTYVKRKQAASFDSLKNSCDGKSIVLQVDFSENAMIAAQKEVQAAHWHHAQATIFTTHTWINNTINFSMVVISDDFNHTKYSSFVFMQCIFQSLQTKFPSIETINVFNNGPTSQFKQRFLFSNLYYWEQDHISWKDVVDGIGGTVKKAVWRHIEVISPLCKSIQHLPNSFAQTFKLNSLPSVTIYISGCQMRRGDGSPPNTQSSLYSSFSADEVKVADTSNEIEKCFRVC